MTRCTAPVFAATAVVLSGCAPALQLQRQPQIEAISWSEELAGGEVPADRRMGLGRALGSPELIDLIERALRRNPDLGIAAARVDQARARLRSARAASLPTVSLSAGSELVSNRGAARSDQGDAFAGLDIAYDLDLFGGAAAASRASRDRIRAAEQDRRALAVLLEADVSRIFVERATLSRRIALLDRNIAKATELARVIAVRRDAGEATAVDVGRQNGQLLGLRAERVRLDLALVQTRSALAILCGEEAPLFRAEPADLDALAIPQFDSADPQILVGARPDVRAAEAGIAAAGGDVASARAAFYPRLPLSGGSFLQSASGGPLDALFSLGASLLAPIFNRGALRGDFEMATARQRESVELYRRTLLAALGETENARAAVTRAAQREQLIEQLAGEARRTAELTRLQYTEGMSDLRDTLDADERLIAAEEALALARQQRIDAAIDLFRATGGRLD